MGTNGSYVIRTLPPRGGNIKRNEAFERGVDGAHPVDWVEFLAGS